MAAAAAVMAPSQPNPVEKQVIITEQLTTTSASRSVRRVGRTVAPSLRLPRRDSSYPAPRSRPLFPVVLATTGCSRRRRGRARPGRAGARAGRRPSPPPSSPPRPSWLWRRSRSSSLATRQSSRCKTRRSTSWPGGSPRRRRRLKVRRKLLIDACLLSRWENREEISELVVLITWHIKFKVPSV